jgi:hypothetical protein
VTKRLWLACACACALASGCGSSGGSSTKTSGVSRATIDAVKREQARAVADCRSAAGNPGLPQDEKVILESECTYIQTGNATALRAAGKQLCTVEAAHQPAAQRASMLAACNAKVR